MAHIGESNNADGEGTVHRILKKELLAQGTWLMRVEAPAVAAKAQAGQFFLVRAREGAERVPFTFCDWNAQEGWIEFVFLVVGRTTELLTTFEEGQELLDVTGPLGNPSNMEGVAGQRWAVAGGGVGLAAAYPVARTLAQAGAQVSAIVAARSRDLLVLEDKFRAIEGADIIVVTDDGSYGEKGFATGPLERLAKAGEIDHAFAVGPVPMMGACVKAVSAYDVPVTVSLNPVMLDGTGMCGGCRVVVDGQVRFACIDGVDFDGAKVDWADLRSRLRTFGAQEKESLELAHACRMQAAADALEGAAR